MELSHASQIVETTSAETVNQYLKFGWKLVGQYTQEPRDGMPARIHYILASFRALEDTRQLVALEEITEINEYLKLGWRLIDKVVTQGQLDGPRHEQIQFILAWTSDQPPHLPGMERAHPQVSDPTMFDDLGDFSQLPPIDEEPPSRERFI